MRKTLLDLVGGPAWVTDLDRDAIASKLGVAYAERVRQARVRRTALSVAAAISRAAQGESFAELRAIVQANAETILSDFEITSTEQLARIEINASLDVDEPIPWTIPGWLGTGDNVLIGAEPGAGKSILALELALALATGTPLMGLLPTRAGRVLIVDEENPVALGKRRLRLFLKGRGLPFDSEQVPLSYVIQNSIRLDDRRSRAMLVGEIEWFKPNWVVLDTLIRFHSGDENSASEMAALFNEHLKPLRSEHGCGFISLHHLSKPPQNGKDSKAEPIHRIRGSIEFQAAPDAVWLLAGDRHTLDRTLTAEKGRWGGGKLPATLSLHYEEDEEEGIATLRAQEARQEADDVITRHLQVVATSGVLRGSLSRWCGDQGVSDGAMRSSLGKMYDRGWIKKRREGREMRYWNKADAPADAL